MAHSSIFPSVEGKYDENYRFSVTATPTNSGDSVLSIVAGNDHFHVFATVDQLIKVNEAINMYLAQMAVSA